MTRFFRKKLLLLRADDAAAFAAADAVVVSNAEITPVVGDRVSRELEQAHFGSKEELLTNKHQTVSFSVEFAAGGAAGAVPPWGLLLQACAFSQTTVVNTSVTYSPVSTGLTHCKVGFQQDNKLHTLTGCLGSVSLETAANNIPRMTFTITGEWNAPADQGVPLAGDFAGWADPQIVSKVNTPTVSIFGQAAIPLSNFKLDVNNTVAHRSLVNADPGVIITDRAPSAELVIDATDWDVFAKAVDNAATGRGAVSVVHGKAGGRQITTNLPVTRIGEPSYGDDNGVLQYTVPLQVLPGAAGNDEISIAIT